MEVPESLAELSAEQRRALLATLLRQRRAAPRRFPLSSAQQRIWFLDQLDPGTAAYNIPAAFRLKGDLQVAVLRAAIGEVIRRHDTLRTVFAVEDDLPVQVVASSIRFDLPVVDLRGLPAAAREREARRLARQEVLRPFDLGRGPLVRTGLLQLSPDEHVALLTLHHIVGDAWSMGLLVREALALYEAPSQRGEAPLADLPVQYGDYVAWQNGWLKSDGAKSQLEYWKRQLAGELPVLELPADRPRPPVPSGIGVNLPVAMPPALRHSLQRLAECGNATLFMVLLAALKALLHRYTGLDEVLIGSPVANRRHREVENLIGIFINTLLLRTGLARNPTFSELLDQVREMALAAFMNQDIPVERVIEEALPGRGEDGQGVFRVVFALQNAFVEEVLLRGVTIRPFDLDVRAETFDLSLGLAMHGEALSGTLTYNPDLFDRERMERFLSHFEVLLSAASERPGLPLSELPLLTLSERRQLAAWSGSAAGPPEVWAHEMFETQAERSPDAPALLHGAEAVSYRELEERSRWLACRIAALGVEPDDRVGIFLDRSPAMIVAVLAVLRAGAAYVPLDPSYPAERLSAMLETVGARVVISRKELAGALPRNGAAHLLLDGPESSLPPPALPAARVSGDHLAYVIFTSGSTGRPKGVAMVHRALANLLTWQRRVPGFDRAVRTLQFASLSFDVSFQEIFLTLATGGTLVLVSEEVRRDPDALARLLAERRVERLFVPFVFLQQLAEAAVGDGTWPASLREVVSAGEQLRITPAVSALTATVPGFALHNQYGPSETHVVTSFALPSSPGRWPDLPPIGQPIGGACVFVLDRWMQPAPIGVPGELYLGGVALARGYLGRPDLTAERFLPDPAGTEPGARLYRTGDLARHLGSGELEYLGRTDQQVKVRGFRVEPAEIESALSQHPGVREAVVAVWESSGVRRLVAYTVPSATQPPAAADLRSWLATRLPPYMVPAAFVSLSALPLTPSGKVNRRALPPPEAGRGELAFREGNLSPVQERIAALWGELLGVAGVRAEYDFFELGGDSMLAVQLVARARRAGLRITVDQVFRYRTVAALAGAAQELPPDGRTPVGAPSSPPRLDGEVLERLERLHPGLEDVYPLTPMQQGVLYHAAHLGGPGDYTGQLGLRLEGEFDEPTFHEALRTVLGRHPALRTRFIWQDLDEPLQLVLRQAEPPLELHDLRRDSPAAQRERIASHVAAEQTERPFQLSREPLLRVAVFTLADDLHEIVWSSHELVLDGWSAALVLGEVRAAYEALKGGGTPELPPSRAFRDYVDWLREQEFGPAESFWRRQLLGFSMPTPLGEARLDSGGTRTGIRYLSRRVSLGLAAGGKLRELARVARVTPSAILQAAWGLVLGRYAAVEDVVFGGVVSGRHIGPEGVESIVGLLLNTLPVRVVIAPSAPFADWLSALHDSQLEAQCHGHAPLSKIQRWSEVPAGMRLFASILDIVTYFRDGGAGSIRDWSRQRVGYPALLVARPDEGWDLELTFEEGALDPAAAERMLGHLQCLLAGMAEAPFQPVSELPYLSRSERAQLLAEWNDTAAPVPPGVCAHQLFEALAAERPDAVAAVCQGELLTYGELNRRANLLARRLAAAGVGPERVVAILAPRGLPFLTAVLAVFKAGAAYLPLDPDHPAPRLLQTLRGSRAGLVLAPDGTVDGLLDSVATAERPRVSSLEHGQGDDGDLAPLTSEANLAYVIYTSGSTGTPKGAMVVQSGMLNHLVSKVLDLELTEADVVAQTASQTFDISVWQLLVPLVVGGRVHVFPDEIARDPRLLLEAVAAAGVTVLELVPSFLALFLEELEQAGRPPLPTLRWLLATGEALQPELCRRWLAAYPDIPVVNAYGPTECSDDVTHLLVRRPPVEGTVHMPVGRPIANTRIHVLDAWHHLVPAGVPGEICIAGAGVGRGYLGDPPRTAAVFVPAISGAPGERMYRAGDLGRLLADGSVEFLGRIDHQVKLRGFRIELGEIEAALERHPAVHQAAVLLREDLPGRKRLVAYVSPCLRQKVEVADLRRFLGEELPEPMIPAVFAVLEILPLTSNGKIDRRALPAPAEPEAGPAAAEGPRSQAEELLGAVWCEILELDRVGRHDSFFESGGHSLLATRLVSAVRRIFRVELPLRAVFETPTLAELARRIELAASSGKATGAEMRACRNAGDELPLSFAQERLWFLQQLEPKNPFYNNSAAVRLAGRPDVEALQRTLSEVVRRHEVLRTTYPTREGRPNQKITPPAPLPLPIVDLSSLGGAKREGEMESQIKAQSRRPFNLEQGPVVRFLLMRLAADDHVALYSIHHIAADAWSTSIFVNEVAAIYPEFCAGQASPLPELALQYADFAQWQRDWLRGDVLDAQLAYWRRALGGKPPVLRLPADRPHPARPSWRGFWRSFALPAGLCQELQRLSRRHGTTLFMSLLAAFSVLLQRSSGQDDVVVGTATANRSRSETEGLIGFFINMLPMRVDLSGNPRFVDLLRRVREIAVEALGHQDVPLEKLVEALRPEGERDGTPLFRVAFGVQNAPTGELQVPGLTIRPVELRQETARFDLTVWVAEQEGGLHVIWNASADLFYEETIERLHRRFEALLGSIAAAPESRIGSLDMLTVQERDAQALNDREWQEQQAGRLSGIRRRKTFSGTPEGSPQQEV